MKVIHVVGARPNFMKLAPLMKEMSKYDSFEQILVHTGQHYDKNMSAVFFQDLGVAMPKYNLNVGSGNHGEQTGKIMIEFEKICLEEKPDLIVIIGDVNSTVACALVSKKLNIKLAHVEAGMRCFNKAVPEEVNRVVADHLADFNFCSTKVALENLRKENIHSGILVGDLMIDLLLNKVTNSTETFDILNKYGLKSKDFFLATTHRVSNVDSLEKLKNILSVLTRLDKKVLFPLHPRTKNNIEKFQLNHYLKHDNLVVVDPLSYTEITHLQKEAALLITDSGGMQKESNVLRTPCVTLREATEWIETLGNGNILVDTENTERMLSTIKYMHSIDHRFQEGLYGNGDAAKKIAGYLNENFG